MSRRYVLIFAVVTAVASLLLRLDTVAQTKSTESIGDLLLKDDTQKAEALLKSSPRSAETIAFQGELEFRKGNFEGARTLYESAIQMNEKTARAHFGLGKLALARVKTKEAMQSFKRAIELDPKEPLYHFYASETADLNKDPAESRKQLEEYVRLNPKNDEDRLTEAKAGLELLKAFGNQEYGIVEAPDAPAPIPLRKALNLIFTDVMINGKGPYNFVIDTGASQTAFSRKLAKDLGLKTITTTIMHGVGGSGKVDSSIYQVDKLQLGDVAIRKLPVGTFDDPVISQLADGIIGTSMLADFVISIDYPKSQMTLSHKPASTTDAIPVWYFSNILLLPADIGGQHGNLILDTGAITSVTSLEVANALGINDKTPGAKVNLGIGGVGGAQEMVLMLPKLTLKTSRQSETLSQVLAIDFKDISKMLGTEVSGIAGFDFLQNYKLTLDYYKAEIHLTK